MDADALVTLISFGLVVVSGLIILWKKNYKVLFFSGGSSIILAIAISQMGFSLCSWFDIYKQGTDAMTFIFAIGGIAHIGVGISKSGILSNISGNAKNVSNVDTDTKSCPFCAETIKKNAIFCKHCNKDLTNSKS